VFHCALLAGLELPIRVSPTAETRFACVRAWLEWGEAEGFCFSLADGAPRRGDIVIYNGIIPPENKPKDCPWYDHIGIVLSASRGEITVAEGNAGNRGVSGVFSRETDERIGRLLRIPEEYTFDGLKYDYKTGKLREENFA
jgi:hypothetical protein